LTGRGEFRVPLFPEDDLLGLVPHSYPLHPDMDRFKRQLRKKA
jgi:hypothetical protein